MGVALLKSGGLCPLSRRTQRGHPAPLYQYPSLCSLLGASLRGIHSHGFAPGAALGPRLTGWGPPAAGVLRAAWAMWRLEGDFKVGIKQVDVIGSRWGGLGECSIFNGGQYTIHRKGWCDFRQLNKAQGVFPETVKERGEHRGGRKETKQCASGTQLCPSSKSAWLLLACCLCEESNRQGKDVPL